MRGLTWLVAATLTWLAGTAVAAGPGRLEPGERQRLRGELREQPWQGGGWNRPPYGPPRDPGAYAPPGAYQAGSALPRSEFPRMSPDERRELRQQLREGYRRR